MLQHPEGTNIGHLKKPRSHLSPWQEIGHHKNIWDRWKAQVIASEYRLALVSCVLFLIVLAGKLAAEVVAERSAGIPHRVGDKDIQSDILERAAISEMKDPVGVEGDGAFPFGGGGVMTAHDRQLLMRSDPHVFRG